MATSTEGDRLRKLARRRFERDYRLECVPVRAVIPRGLREEMRALMVEDRMTFQVLIQACVQGYVERHPAVLAMLDQWNRDNDRKQDVVLQKKTLFSGKELEDLFAEMKIEEDEDV